MLDAIAHALQLDEAARAHLFDVARAANTRPARAPRRRSQPRVLPSVRRILAINPLGHALYAPVFDDPARPANLARFAFLDPRALDLYPDWQEAANTTVALLRTEAGRDPYDRALSDLVGELATRSEQFRTRWAPHNVRLRRIGVKHFHHPVVGTLDLAFDAMELPADPGLTMTAYTAEPGSSSADGLHLLASWAATLDQADSTQEADQTQGGGLRGKGMHAEERGTPPDGAEH